MKEALEKLWNEYFMEECSVISTDEEKILTKQALELGETTNILLNKEQKEAVEKYIDALCRIDALFIKKAFFIGCEFAVSFLLRFFSPLYTL